MALIMEHGKSQTLLKNLPDQTYNWDGRKGSFIGKDDVDTREMDVPRAWIKRSLGRLIRPFVEQARADGIALPYMTVIEKEQFALLEPRRLRGELFPRTYVCRTCGHFSTTDESPERVKCPKHGREVQWSFVEFHGCGHISGLVPPVCKNHCRAGMLLVNRSSRSFKDWEWKCARCNTKAERGVYRYCPSCKKGMVGVMRADAGTVFYPQYVNVVNPPARDDYALLDNDIVYRAAVAQALGALPLGLDGLRKAMNDGGSVESLEKARRQLIEDYGLDEDDPMLDTMLKRRQQKAGAQQNWTAAVDALGLSEEIMTELGFQCVELTLTREGKVITLDDLVKQAPPAMKPLYDVTYRDVLDRYGFAEATLIREFPRATVVAGYTRDSRKPAPGVMFNFFKGADGNYAMYGQRTETEAILFRLDPARVLKWLVASGIVDDPGDVNAQAWLFSVMQPVTSVFDPPGDRITRSVLGLVHSVAHRVLKAVAIRSGLAAESLAEYLLPHNLAFAIYANTGGEFVLGGLEHVYRNYLADSLAQVDADRRCVFDPPCNRNNGACAQCMYLSETSCDRFNKTLSRWYLFGGTDPEEKITWQGYWNASIP